jgi:hypothetical protein
MKRSKKRGRKPKNIKLNNLDDFQEKKSILKKNLILHLSISFKNIFQSNDDDLLHFNQESFLNPYDNKEYNTIDYEFINEIQKEKEINTLNEQYNFKNENKLLLFKDKYEVWNMKTIYPCLHCTLKFDTLPIGIPYDIKKDIFYLYGNYCSFECCYSDILLKKISDKSTKISNLYLLKNKLYNDYSKINEAPPKEFLKEYGGTMTHDEYKHFTKKYVIQIYNPPIRPYTNTILFNEKTSHMNDTKLKRNNPILKNMIDF